MVSELKRRREVYRLFPPHLRGADLHETLQSDDTPLPPDNFTPRPSPDDALTLFAQTTCHRLGVARAFISLLDGEHQFILAESSAVSRFGQGQERENGHAEGGDVSEKAQAADNGQEQQSDSSSQSLWLGNCCIPRHRGFCRAALAIEQRMSPLVIPDLSADQAFKDLWCVAGHPYWRFYAAYPLYGDQDAIVGDICVFDTRPRPHGVHRDEIEYLDEISGAITRYLATLRVRRDQARRERMISGLLDFNNRGSTRTDVKPSTSHASLADEPQGSSRLFPTSTRNDHERDSEVYVQHQQNSPSQSPSHRANELEQRAGFREQDSGASDKQEITAKHDNRASSTEPKASFTQERLSAYARAANILRMACDFDGVAFVDASIAAIGIGRDEAVHQARRPSGSIPLSRLMSNSPTANGRLFGQAHGTEGDCPIMALSTAKRPVQSSDIDDDKHVFSSAVLRGIVQHYSNGKAFEIALDPLRSSSSEMSNEGDDDWVVIHPSNIGDEPRSLKGLEIELAQEVLKLNPRAREFCVLPLWNFDYSKWCACGIFWTEQSGTGCFDYTDFNYLRTFANSIMMELSRLHAVEVDRIKTSFVASISHELRTPLHGLLGAAELMKNSAENSFQSSMLDIIQSSGNTLLDILEHVLDYSRVKGRSGSMSETGQSTTDKSAIIEAGQVQQIQYQDDQPRSVFNIAQVTEEVVDSIYEGQARHRDAHRSQIILGHTKQDFISTRNKHDSTGCSKSDVQLVLRIDPVCSRNVYLSIGGWRRIVMNLLSNALKYTNSGHILVSLDSESESDSIKLVVEDTGIGMTQSFVTHDAYAAFTQENPFAQGLGLGLHITQQLVASLNGVIEMSSIKGVGTRAGVVLSIPAQPYTPPPSDLLGALAPFSQELRTKSFGIFCDSAPCNTRQTISGSDDGTLRNKTIALMLEAWFGITPVFTNRLDGEFDSILYLGSTASSIIDHVVKLPRPKSRSVLVISVPHAAESVTVQNDPRIAKSGRVVTVVSEPLGPFKMANVLKDCLEQFRKDVTVVHTPDFSCEEAMEVDEMEGIIIPSSGDLRQATPSLKPPTPSVDSALRPDVPLTPPDMPQGSDVLIVDDNKINRRLLVALLKKHRPKLGFAEAADGLEALTLYRSNPRRWMIILMDVSMPIMDGFTSAREIRAYETLHELSPVKIIAVTGLAEATNIQEAIQSGIDDYLTKPVRFEKMIKLL